MSFHIEQSVPNREIDTAEDKWKIAPVQPALIEGDIDLWSVELDSISIESSFKLLSGDEKFRANKYFFSRDRQHFVVGRASLRKILGRYLGIAPETIRFSTRPFGKPFLADDCGVRFNVSHSKGVAVIAVSMNRELGVDIEFVKSNFDVFSIAQSVFSEAEILRMRSLPPNLQVEAFFAGWTRKEAFLKATGDGLSGSKGLRKAVSMINHEDVSWTFENNKMTEWRATSFDINDGFKSALVVEGSIGNIKYLELKG